MSTGSFIVIERILDSRHHLLERIEKTYNDSFPPVERRDFSLLREFIDAKPHFEVFCLLRDDQYVGFITGWQLDGFVFAEHFAIDEAFRNGGVGAQAMDSFIAAHSMPVVLEVELPSDSLSKRRIGFYERLGFRLDNHEYFQPPYSEGDQPLELRLMTYGDLDLNQSFTDIRNAIYSKVYEVQ